MQFKFQSHFAIITREIMLRLYCIIIILNINFLQHLGKSYGLIFIIILNMIASKKYIIGLHRK